MAKTTANKNVSKKVAVSPVVTNKREKRIVNPDYLKEVSGQVTYNAHAVAWKNTGIGFSWNERQQLVMIIACVDNEDSPEGIPPVYARMAWELNDGVYEVATPLEIINDNSDPDALLFVSSHITRMLREGAKRSLGSMLDEGADMWTDDPLYYYWYSVERPKSGAIKKRAFVMDDNALRAFPIDASDSTRYQVIDRALPKGEQVVATVTAKDEAHAQAAIVERFSNASKTAAAFALNAMIAKDADGQAEHTEEYQRLNSKYESAKRGVFDYVLLEGAATPDTADNRQPYQIIVTPETKYTRDQLVAMELPNAFINERAEKLPI